MGSWVTVAFGSEAFDQGGNFASNTFTAPADGNYQLQTNVLVKNIDTASNYYQLKLVAGGRSYYYTFDPGGFSGDTTNYLEMTISVLADMDANDTAIVWILHNNGTSQSDIDSVSFFSGFLAC